MSSRFLLPFLIQSSPSDLLGRLMFFGLIMYLVSLNVLVKDVKGFFSQRTISISERTWKITENIFHHIFDTGLLIVRVVEFVKYILQFFM